MRGKEREEAVAEKPWGGFIPIAVSDIAEVWSAYQEGDLSLNGLRGYFAMRELHGWRAAVKARDTSVRLVRGSISKTEVLKTLGGIRRGQAKKILTELREANLVAVSKTGIQLGAGKGRAAAMLDAIAGEERTGRRATASIPIPRTVLKRLGTRASPVEIATVLGISLRCLFLRKRDGQMKCVFGGACSAAWISTVFGVHVRRVREHRRRWIERGWLREAESQQPWHERRYGRWFIPNMDFERPALQVVKDKKCTKSPGEGRQKCTDRSGVIRQTSSLREGFNRNPKGAVVSKTNRKFGDVSRDDLNHTERILQLHRHAVAVGLWGGSEHDAAEFIALSLHAKRKGTVNVAGLFFWLVREKKTAWITEADSDNAHRMLKEARHPELSDKPNQKQMDRPRGAISRAEFQRMTVLEQAQWKLDQRRTAPPLMRAG